MVHCVDFNAYFMLRKQKTHCVVYMSFILIQSWLWHLANGLLRVMQKDTYKYIFQFFNEYRQTDLIITALS